MLKIVVPAGELWNEKTNEFIRNEKDFVLQLEHSLISVSKWEAKWHKLFLTDDKKTVEETLSYVECMTLNSNVNKNIYLFLTAKNLKEIDEYISNPMTATTFSNIDNGNKINGERVSSELVYYWMTVFGIPAEYQKWHLNRLITLIKICNVKNQPPKKQSKSDIARQYAALNEARKKKMHTKG